MPSGIHKLFTKTRGKKSFTVPIEQQLPSGKNA